MKRSGKWVYRKSVSGFKILLLLFLLVLPGERSLWAEQTDPADRQLFVLTVRVMDTLGEPISEAVVFINDEIDAISDTEGYLSFQLQSGTYAIQSYMPDYLDYHGNIEMTNADKYMEIQHLPAMFWSSSPAPLPIGVGEANGLRMAAAGDHIYVWTAYGGTPGTSSWGGRNEFFRYDPEQDFWEALPDSPFTSSYGITTASGPDEQGAESIYILRGYWAGQRTWMARFNTLTGQWQEGLNHQIPWRLDLGAPYSGSGFQNYPRNGSVMVYGHDGYMYLLPGSGYSYQKYDWYRYDIANDSWQDLGQLPHRQGPGNAAAWVSGEATDYSQDYIYVQFGVTPSGTYTHAEFWRYGMQNQQWEKLADHGFGADDGSQLAWDGGNYIYHVPGAYQEQSWDRGLSQKRAFMRYSIRDNMWSPMEDTPYNRWGGWDDAGGIVLLGNWIYGLKGGCDVAWAEGETVSGGGNIPSDHFWKYRLESVNFDVLVSDPIGQGNIRPGTGLYSQPLGARMKFEAEPADGWQLENWVLNSQEIGNDNPIWIEIDQDISLSAVFHDTGLPVPEHDMLVSEIRLNARELWLMSEVPGLRIDVYDLFGRHLYHFFASRAGEHIFSHGLKRGVYLVRISHASGYSQGHRFIIP